MRQDGVDRDVVILGGGLSGLSLAIQLRRTMPNVSVTVLERASFPLDEATHKVGESTVEIGALYFADTLGMRDVMNETQLPKFGLRFFFSSEDNEDISARSEVGLRSFLPVKTWQLDRGRFENQLAARAVELGAEVIDDAKVGDVEIDGSRAHTVHFTRGDIAQTLRARWVVDASGRRAILKKQLSLAKRTQHLANASWWRVAGDVDLSDWSHDAEWRGWTSPSRRFSTNHLMGDGYWVWLIPLASGHTSVGIVVDDRIHPFSTMRSPALADAWLQTHEPQVFRELQAYGERKDFLMLKHYCHSAEQVYSHEGRWALVGEAGTFLDPFYSPGSDFIGIANTFTTDIIRADLANAPDAAARAAHWNRHYLRLFRALLSTYTGRYPIMGRPAAMRAKLLWDFTFYWAGHALTFSQGHLLDAALYEKAEPLLNRTFSIHLSLQALFTRWAKNAPRFDQERIMLDYASATWVRDLNEGLITFDDRSAYDRLRKNAALMEQLGAEFSALALAHDPSVGELGIDGLPQATGALFKDLPLYP